MDSEVDSVVFTKDPNLALHSFRSEALHNDDSVLGGKSGSSNPYVIKNAKGTVAWKKAWVRDFTGSEGSHWLYGDTYKGILNSVEDEDSFGPRMTPSARDDLGTDSDTDLLTANVDDDSFDMSDSALVDASMFGGDAGFGFTGANRIKVSAMRSEKPVYITFSGGGHSMQFSSSISSNIDSAGESYTFEIEDEVANSANFEVLLLGVVGEISGGQVARNRFLKNAPWRGRNMAIWKSRTR